MNKDNRDLRQGHPPEQPRSEPEIIPPGAGGSDPRSQIWISVDRRGGTHRIYLARPGPFAIMLGLALVGLIAAAILLVLLSAVLIWIPVAILVIGALLLSGYIRYYWRRFQVWISAR
jgi:hypothetical protein